MTVEVESATRPPDARSHPQPVGTERAVRAAYARCRRMQLRHDPTYYFATRCLPSGVRPAVHALYGFVRGADELVDGPHRALEPTARKAALDHWERELETGLENGHSSHPVIAALVDAGPRHELPLAELSVYMDSMRVDCDRVRIDSWSELERYMRGSAGAVGLIMAPLLGAPRTKHASFAHLGAAFQLTNFIRDVREDHALDRLYLPAEDLDRFGVSEEQIARREVTPGFRALIAHAVVRARGMFADSAPALDAVSRRVRPGMRLARTVYLRTLDRIQALDYDVLRRRAALSPWQLGGAAVAAVRAT